MSKSAALNVMGTPDNRSFRGDNEAWQYQQIAGFGQCSYITVWFHDSTVLGVTSQNGPSIAGCGLGSHEVDWGQVPKPTSTLNINVKTEAE